MKRIFATVAAIPLVLILLYSGLNLLLTLVADFFSGFKDLFSLNPLPLTIFSSTYFVGFIWFIFVFASYQGLLFCWKYIKYD
jgi:hypothetical protein